MHAYLYAYVTMDVCYVCTYIIRYLKNYMNFFHYSECHKFPITQATNCMAESTTSIKIHKMSKNGMPNITWKRKKYITLGNGSIMP